MSSPIPAYKLSSIRRSLVSSRYSEKIAEGRKTIGKLIYDTVYSNIPEPVMDMFRDVESEYINKMRRDTLYFKAITNVQLCALDNCFKHAIDMMRVEGIIPINIQTIHFDLPSPLPCNEKFMDQILLEEINKKTELYDALKKYILYNKEISTLDKKISCLFSSKHFYPRTLKKEFPEAYEVYVKLFPEEEQSPKPTACDSIESIRATLISNK